jgi:hypothetical protein
MKSLHDPGPERQPSPLFALLDKSLVLQSSSDLGLAITHWSKLKDFSFQIFSRRWQKQHSGPSKRHFVRRVSRRSSDNLDLGALARKISISPYAASSTKPGRPENENQSRGP